MGRRASDEGNGPPPGRRFSGGPVRGDSVLRNPAAFSQIAVASGKGGTGKTTVATNLAVVAARAGRRVTYLDADVEAPNGHLFLNPELAPGQSVELMVPRVSEEACTACGQCAELCQYGAIIKLAQRVLVFSELCHGCGGCVRVCPEEAISEQPLSIGVVEEGSAGPLRFIRGRLQIGYPLAPPIIRAARARLNGPGLRLIDAPPGTACATVQAVEGTDYVLLVAEPTPFGLSDLGLTVAMLRAMGLRFGVVINRADHGIGDMRSYCRVEGIEVLLELPDDRRVAEAYSRGELVIDSLPEFRPAFEALLAKVEKRAA